MSLSAIIIKIPFLSSPLISLYCKFVNRASYTRTNIFIYGDCLADIPVELTDMFMEVI